jgi:hypothetical protein
VLRRIFGPKMEEVTGGWRRLCNEEVHNLYASPNIVNKSRRMRWVEHAACMKTMRSIQYFGWKTQRKETTWKTKHSWEDNIRMDVREIGWQSVERIHLT